MTNKYHENDFINENRDLWLEQLHSPESEKAVSMLEDGEYENARCCLGHACYALGIEREVEQLSFGGVLHTRVYYDHDHEVLSEDVAQMLDITPNGDFINAVDIAEYYPDLVLYNEFLCLSELNDRTELDPQQIAVILADQFVKRNMRDFDSTII